MEAKMKYLDLIQGVITRMANNSFLLKGWTVTLLAGIFALADGNANLWFYFIAYVPIVTFWFLDSYYLQQERLYRAIYKRAIEIDEENVTFDLTPTEEDLGQENVKFDNCLLSKTEKWFYIPLALVLSVTILAVALTR